MELITHILMGIAVTLAPCPYDEAIGTCHWDGSTRGNGDGVSFISIGPDDGSDATAFHTFTPVQTPRIGEAVSITKEDALGK